jgi:thiol-disulfide isomerase/thioredoxin
MGKFFSYCLLVFCFFVTHQVIAQSVSGTFKTYSNQEIHLQGFDGFNTYVISSSRASIEGHIKISYTSNDVGMAYLIGPDDQSFLVVLSGEDIELQGDSFAHPESIQIIRGEQNKLFERYASEHPRREQALSAWVYLNRIYQSDSLFSSHSRPSNDIVAEINRIKSEDENFLAQLDPDSYLHWYLPVRKTVSLVSVVAQFRTEEIPQTLASLRALDPTDNRLLRSGLLTDALQSHIWLIENSGPSLDSVFVELNASMDIMIDYLADDPATLNSVMGFVYDLLEKRSLFTSAEYLALRLLTDFESSLRPDFAAKLESYRAMRIGNVAADIPFSSHTWFPNRKAVNSLSELDADFIVVVFATGWCPTCQQVIQSLVSDYPMWKEQGVELVAVSLDENLTTYKDAFGNAPFIVTTDLLGWDSPLAKSFHVYSIPTFYLLDPEQRIVLRPNSLEHLNTWVDWYLAQGNPRN